MQISGGEPTLHPDFFAILDRAKAAPDPAPDGEHQRHAHRAATRSSRSGSPTTCRTSRSTCSSTRSSAAPLLALRGADLRDVRARALERLNRLGISTTLVVTLKKGAERRRDRPDHRLRARRSRACAA